MDTKTKALKQTGTKMAAMATMPASNTEKNNTQQPQEPKQTKVKVVQPKPSRKNLELIQKILKSQQ